MKSLRILSIFMLLALVSACQPVVQPTPAASEEPVRWQDQSWTWTASSGTVPAAFRAMGSVHDSARQRIVLFGGLADQPLAETWEYDGAAWQRIPTTASPPARFWHGMAYDPVRQVTILFGGMASDIPGDYLDDTWQYDGRNWQQVTSAHSPGPRGRGALLVYDTCRQKTVLFGGQTPNGLSTATWEFDGTDWSEVSLPVDPPGRFLAGMAFDPQRCVSVLFGGGGSDLGGFADTWEYDGKSWTQVQTAHDPDGRWAHAMAYEPATGTILLVGGYEPLHGRMLEDTWRYDSMDWEEVTTLRSAGQMEQASLAWDGSNERMLLFGFGSSWSLDASTPGSPPTAATRTHTSQATTGSPGATTTASNTPRPSATATIPGTPGCAGGFSRLQAGNTAILTAGGPPNRVRTEPVVDEGNIIGLLYENTTVTILGGPVCADGLVFWKIEVLIDGRSMTGWTAEGDGTDYYLAPYSP
jgi:hypothetical protein